MYAFTVLCFFSPPTPHPLFFPLFFLIRAFFGHFDIDVCIYSTCTFVVVVVVVVDCQADFDVDNVQRRELVNFTGYSAR